jgi:hypothetical protein
MCDTPMLFYHLRVDKPCASGGFATVVAATGAAEVQKLGHRSEVMCQTSGWRTKTVNVYAGIAYGIQGFDAGVTPVRIVHDV